MSGPEQLPSFPPAPTAEDAPESPLDGPGAGSSRQPEAGPAAGGSEANAASTADSAAAPTTPLPAPNADRIQIIVKDQTGNQVGFALKPNTRMAKVMNAYADRQSRDVRSLRFFVDGVRVLEDSTPASLEMQQDDIVEVSTEQLGGGRLPRRQLATKSGVREKNFNESEREKSTEVKDLEKGDRYTNHPDKVNYRISVRATKVGGKDIPRVDFNVDGNVSLTTLQKAWSKRTGIPLHDVVFRWDDKKGGPGLSVDVDDMVGNYNESLTDSLYVDDIADEPIDLTELADLGSDDEDEEGSVTLELESEPEPKSDLIFITVHFGNKRMHVRMNTTTPFQKILDKYAESRGEDLRDFHLTHKGNVIFNNDTPDIIGLETGDELAITNDSELLLLLDLVKL